MLERRVWKLSNLKAGLLFCLLFSLPTAAQIVPDGTLPVNSIITPQGSTSLIKGGTTKGGNLFHSFRQFSVPTNGTAYFNNGANIQTIFSRVTEGSISKIDGLLQTNGSASLFLLNPNGVVFGPNARLNIGGSFISSTAESINFADGTQFSAAPQETPLLTVSVPVGLQLGTDPSSISLEGPGHNLITLSFSPFIGAGAAASGLRVLPGNTLALVGGNVTLDGGVLSGPGSQVEVGGAADGVVKLNPNSSGWTFDYSQVASFRDIRLSTRSLIDVSGSVAGSIQAQGRNVSLVDGSAILIQNQGILPSGAIRVNASDSLEVSGTDPIARIPGGLRTDALGPGDGGNIFVSAPNLTLTAGGSVTTATYSTAKAGNTVLEIPDSLQLLGGSPRTSRLVSNIISQGTSSGEVGDIRISTGSYIARNGGLLLTLTTEEGEGGDVKVTATDRVELIGVEPTTLAPSSINTGTVGSQKAGDLTVNAPKVFVRDGGRIGSTTIASGAAGDVTINAPDSVEISGTVPGSFNPSLIISAANTLDGELLEAFSLPNPSTLSGNSGKVTINTAQLNIGDGGQAAVRNDGTGDAGTLEINANSINLNNEGGITASTAQGEGGNIEFTDNNLLLLQNKSFISASASGTGRGGNITANTDLLAALSDSTFTATAVNELGGNIIVNAQGVFLPPNASFDDIFDASSQEGSQFDGSVEINTPDVDLSRSAAEPPLQQESAEVGLACQNSGNTASKLVSSGTGGIPPSPSKLTNNNSGWVTNPVPQVSKKIIGVEPLSPNPARILVAQGWKRNGDGTGSMVSTPAGALTQNPSATPPCSDAKASTP